MARHTNVDESKLSPGEQTKAEARREYQRRYYQAHKEKAKEYQRQYNLTHKKKKKLGGTSGKMAKREVVRTTLNTKELMEACPIKLAKMLKGIVDGDKDLVS